MYATHKPKDYPDKPFTLGNSSRSPMTPEEMNNFMKNFTIRAKIRNANTRNSKSTADSR